MLYNHAPIDVNRVNRPCNCCQLFPQPRNASWSRFYVAGEAIGTIRGIMHSDRRKFDAEDDRVMAALGNLHVRRITPCACRERCSDTGSLIMHTK